MKILLAEDEEKLAKLVKRVLEEERYQVDIAYDGLEAIDYAGRGIYDLFILDVMLPGKDGFAICRWIREQEIFSPVLLLTARSQVEDIVHGLDVGADDYLTKPFAFEVLLARIRALLRRPPAMQVEASLDIDDLKLDLVSHQVICNNHTLNLTIKEFALLEFFMRHPGQALTRDQLLINVWPYDKDLASNVVDIYVHYLRTKLENAGKTNLLKTVRGIGYMLTPPAAGKK